MAAHYDHARLAHLAVDQHNQLLFIAQRIQRECADAKLLGKLLGGFDQSEQIGVGVREQHDGPVRVWSQLHQLRRGHRLTWFAHVPVVVIEDKFA